VSTGPGCTPNTCVFCPRSIARVTCVRECVAAFAALYAASLGKLTNQAPSPPAHSGTFGAYGRWIGDALSSGPPSRWIRRTIDCSRGLRATAGSRVQNSSDSTLPSCSSSTAARDHPCADRARRRARAVGCRPVARLHSSAIPVR
jgi:hypothetical protein